MELPLRTVIDASALENQLAAALAQHRQELFANLARIESLLEVVMSGTADLRSRFEAELSRIADEIRETRSAAEGMRTALQGLRGQLNAALDELRANGVKEEDIAALAEFSATLDTMQQDMASAAAENVDNGGGATPEPAPEPAPEEPAPAPEPTDTGAPVEPPPEEPAPAEPAPEEPAPVPEPTDTGAPVEPPPEEAVAPEPRPEDGGLRPDQIAGTDSGVDNSATPSSARRR